jgi:hypothetical protein
MKGFCFLIMVKGLSRPNSGKKKGEWKGIELRKL